MKCLDVFFNEEAADYVRDALGCTNAIKIKDNADVEAASGWTSFLLRLSLSKKQRMVQYYTLLCY